jgi:hypothetical protein
VHAGIAPRCGKGTTRDKNRTRRRFFRDDLRIVFFFRRSEGGDKPVARQTLPDKHRSLFYQVCTWTNEWKGEMKGGCSNPDKRTEKRDQKAEENADP